MTLFSWKTCLLGDFAVRRTSAARYSGYGTLAESRSTDTSARLDRMADVHGLAIVAAAVAGALRQHRQAEDAVGKQLPGAVLLSRCDPAGLRELTPAVLQALSEQLLIDVFRLRSDRRVDSAVRGSAEKLTA